MAEWKSMKELWNHARQNDPDNNDNRGRYVLSGLDCNLMINKNDLQCITSKIRFPVLCDSFILFVEAFRKVSKQRLIDGDIVPKDDFNLWHHLEQETLLTPKEIGTHFILCHLSISWSLHSSSSQSLCFKNDAVLHPSSTIKSKLIKAQRKKSEWIVHRFDNITLKRIDRESVFWSSTNSE